MNQLERIKKAWAMGWSATVDTPADGKLQVVGIAPGDQYRIAYFAFTREDRMVTDWLDEGKDVMQKLKILGYLYGAELCGSETIPRNQKFRIKNTGEILEFGYKEEYYNLFDDYKPQELEPFFD